MNKLEYNYSIIGNLIWWIIHLLIPLHKSIAAPIATSIL